MRRTGRRLAEHALRGKTVLITGASRGIGLCLAKKLAADGANIVVAAKTAEPHPKLPGTIHTAVDECRARGGAALAVVCNVANAADIDNAVTAATEKFGGIDILVNNASAIDTSDTSRLAAKKYDLLHAVNGRGAFLCTQRCLPLLQASARAGRNPHVLTMSPPLTLDPRWFKAGGTAYAMSKYNMTMATLGVGEEQRGNGIAFNCLWPQTAVATEAVRLIAGEIGMQASRMPDVMADAAHWILKQDSAALSGNAFIDEAVLREKCGKSDADMDAYRVRGGFSGAAAAIGATLPLAPDLFVGDPGEIEKYLAAARSIASASDKLRSMLKFK